MCSPQEVRTEFQLKGCLGSSVLQGGEVHKTIKIPVAIESDKITADLKDGILKVILPKAEGAKPKQITVQV